MREYDELCLVAPPAFSPDKIKMLHARFRVSQPILAAYLNVGPSTVAQWGRGAKKPSGPALRLLDIVDRKGLDALA